MADTQPNLRFIRKSRKPLCSGDVFAMQLPNELYLFGRVILVEPPFPAAPGPSCNLVYIYATQSTEKAPELHNLNPDNLLLPPMWTNRLGWMRGFFETIGNRALSPSDLLKTHCFSDPLFDRYLDERGNRLIWRSEPCGEWGLVSYRYIDLRVSEALGLPPILN